MILRMAKCKIRNLEIFKINIWSFYQNILENMGKKKLVPNDSLFLSNLNNVK